MAEKAYFFDSADGDRIYNASDFAKVFDGIVSDGVVPGKDEQLQVVLGEGLQVIVKTGAAWVQGRYYRNDSSKALVVPEADSSHDRIDRVVLRLDLSINARKIEAVIKQGVPAENPAALELQRDALIYEFPLYQYMVEAGAAAPTYLWDERTYFVANRIGSADGAHRVYEIKTIGGSLAIEEVS